MNKVSRWCNESLYIYLKYKRGDKIDVWPNYLCFKVWYTRLDSIPRNCHAILYNFEKKTAFLPYKNYIQMYFFINENVMGDCHGRWTAVISDTFRLGSHDVIVDTFSLSALFRTLKPHANKCFSDLGLRKKSCRKTTVNTTRIKPFI